MGRVVPVGGTEANMALTSSNGGSTLSEVCRSCTVDLAIHHSGIRTFVTDYGRSWSIFIPAITLLQIGAFFLQCGILINDDDFEDDNHTWSKCLEPPADGTDLVIPSWMPFRSLEFRADGSCHDLRAELWRLITPLFAHAGILHLFVNMFVQLFVGIPMEIVHSWYRVATIYLVGQLFAMLFYAAFTDGDTGGVGASGAVYALIGAHWANLLINSEADVMYERWIRLIFLTILAVADLVAYFADRNASIGYTSHLGGGIAGLCIGAVVLRNIREQDWERTAEKLLLGGVVGGFVGLIVLYAVEDGC